MSNSDNTPVTAEALSSVLGGLITGIESEARGAFEAWASLPAVVTGLEELQRGNLERFRLFALRPLQQVVDGLALHVSPTSREAQFLIKHSDFVASHFRAVIEVREGWACCADKTRWIVRALYRHFHEGSPIMLDYEQEYTYHLPREVFNTEAAIVEFFRALYSLYYGRGEDFATLRQKLAAVA